MITDAVFFVKLFTISVTLFVRGVMRLFIYLFMVYLYLIKVEILMELYLILKILPKELNLVKRRESRSKF